MNATERAQRKIDGVAALRKAVASGALTIEQVAARLRVEQETVRQWIRGDTLPSGRRVDDLLRVVA